MKIQLTVQEWMAPPEMKIEWSTHPAYRNLRKHLKSANTSHDDYTAYLIKFLADINARVLDIDSDRTVFEFDSEEDLTQFLLAWS